MKLEVKPRHRDFYVAASIGWIYTVVGSIKLARLSSEVPFCGSSVFG